MIKPLAPSDHYPGSGTAENPFPQELLHFGDPFVALAAASAGRSRSKSCARSGPTARSGTKARDGTSRKSTFSLTSAQRPGPPIRLGAAAPAALHRVGRIADGWLPAYFPDMDEVLTGMWTTSTQAAGEAGRDPAALRRVRRG